MCWSLLHLNCSSSMLILSEVIRDFLLWLQNMGSVNIICEENPSFSCSTEITLAKKEVLFHLFVDSTDQHLDTMSSLKPIIHMKIKMTNTRYWKITWNKQHLFAKSELDQNLETLRGTTNRNIHVWCQK